MHAAPASPGGHAVRGSEGALMRHVLSTSARSAWLTSSGLHLPTRGGPTEYYANGDNASLSPTVRSARHRRPQAPMGDCKPWRGAGEEHTVRHRRPQTQPGLRATAEAARRNATKPQRLRAYRDAGREWTAAGRSMHQAGASTFFKAPQAEESDGVASHRRAGAAVRSRSGHACFDEAITTCVWT